MIMLGDILKLEALTVIMHDVARFCTSGERARASYPTGWIGVRQLAVQRVWGLFASVGGSAGHAAPQLTGRIAAGRARRL
jgi:hypothetical protein